MERVNLNKNSHPQTRPSRVAPAKQSTSSLRPIPEEAAVSEGGEGSVDRFEKPNAQDRPDIGQCSDAGARKQQDVDDLFRTTAADKAMEAPVASGPKRPGARPVMRASALPEAELEYFGRGNWGLAWRSGIAEASRWRNIKGHSNLFVKHVEQHGAFSNLYDAYNDSGSKTTLRRAIDRRNSFIESLVHALGGTYVRGGTRQQMEVEATSVISGFASEIDASVDGRVGYHRVGTDSDILAALYRKGDKAEKISGILKMVQTRLDLPSAINLNLLYRSAETGAYEVANFNPKGGLPLFLIYPGAGRGGVHAFVPRKSTRTLFRDLSKLVQRVDEREAYERINENVEYASRYDVLLHVLSLGLDGMENPLPAEYGFIQALVVSANARYANKLLPHHEVWEKTLQIVETMMKDGCPRPTNDVITGDAAMVSQAIALVRDAFGLPSLKPYRISTEESPANGSQVLRCSPLVLEEGLPLYIFRDIGGVGLYEGVKDDRVSAKAICRSDIRIAELRKRLIPWGEPISYGVGEGNDFIRNLASAANIAVNTGALALPQVTKLVAYLARRVAEQGVENLDDALDFPNNHGFEVQRAVDFVTSELCRFFDCKFDITVHRCVRHPDDRALLRLEQFPLLSHGWPGLNVFVNDALNDRSKRYSMLMPKQSTKGSLSNVVSNVTKRLLQMRAQDETTQEDGAGTTESTYAVRDEEPEASAASSSASKEKRKAKKKRSSRRAQPDVTAQAASRDRVGQGARSDPAAEALSRGVAGQGVQPDVAVQSRRPGRAPPLAQPEVAAQPVQAVAPSLSEQAEAAGEVLHDSPSGEDPALNNYGARGRDVFSAAELEMTARAEALRLLESAKAEEPGLTAMFESAAEEHGGRLVAKENRVKSEASLRRKIVARAGQRIVLGEPMDVFVRKACANINDVLRYTAELPADRYRKAFDASVESLAERGIKLLYLFDGWTPDSPFIGTYRGVNATFQSPDGLLVELQIHTPASFAMREELHAMYEEARSTSTTPGRRADLEEIMRERWKEVPVPPA